MLFVGSTPTPTTRKMKPPEHGGFFCRLKLGLPPPKNCHLLAKLQTFICRRAHLPNTNASLLKNLGQHQREWILMKDAA